MPVMFPQRVAIGYVNNDMRLPIYASHEFLRALASVQGEGAYLIGASGGIDVFASFYGANDGATAGVGADIAQPRQVESDVALVQQVAPEFVEFPQITQPIWISDPLKEDKANKDASDGYVGLTLFKINFKNAANTFISFFTNANTAARTYTFPDKDLTVAGLIDFAAPPAIGNTTPAAGSFTTVNGTGAVTAMSGTAIPAGGTAGAGVRVSSAANFGVFFGSGVPTLSAAKGSLYLRSDGTSTSTRAYINTDGGTNWTAVTTAA